MRPPVLRPIRPPEQPSIPGKLHHGAYGVAQLVAIAFHLGLALLLLNFAFPILAPKLPLAGWLLGTLAGALHRLLF